MIMKTKIKEYVNGKGFNMSSEFVDKLEEDLLVVLDRATERAEENGRKTVTPRDL